MTSFVAYKQQVKKPGVYKPIVQELDKAPRQFNDYMNSMNGRFSEICKIYLDGLSMDDIKYLKPDDLIALVPESQFNHKLLMTIMVRRYLYRPDECETVYCKPDQGDTYGEKPDKNNDKTNDKHNDKHNDRNSDDTCSTYSNSSEKSDRINEKNGNKRNDGVYACDKCTHACTNANCKHSCSDYAKIIHRTK
jgi:hypothetical protein